MHKSKLAGFIIDCNTADLNAAAEFWGQALGMGLQFLPGEEGTKYVRLREPNDALHIEVQKVTHPSRVHLDIETDNIEAEVQRLTELGAQTIETRENWCVMEAPTGQRFCVVRKSSTGFEQLANAWHTQ